METEKRKYGTIITEVGLRKIALAVNAGQKVNLTQFAVGDGAGEYYQPTPDMTELKGQKWRGSICNKAINENMPNVIDISTIIPASVGGWTIREMAVFDDKGNMIAICNTPDTEKFLVTSGAAGEIEAIIHIEVSDTEAVTCTIDPNIVSASKKELEDEISARAAADEALQEDLTEETSERTAADTALQAALNGKSPHVCRFVVGTSTAGWTEADVDYLCDGVEDQEEIKAAIQALPVEGGEIVLLDGTYNITRSTIIEGKTGGVTITGSGDSTVLKRVSTSSFAFLLSRVSNCRIRNLKIDCNMAEYYTTSSVTAFEAQKVSGNIFENCSVANARTPIYLSGEGHILRNNYIEAEYIAIRISNSNNITLYNNRVVYVKVSPNNTETLGGLFVDTLSGAKQITVTQNTVLTGGGIKLSGCADSIISNNYVKHGGITCSGGSVVANNVLSGNGITLGNNCIVSGNVCICGVSNPSNETYGVTIGYSENSIVDGNILCGFYNGICLNGAKYSRVSNNICLDSTNCGIFVHGNTYGSGDMYIASDNIITGNTCIRNTGEETDYSSTQYTIYLYGAKCVNNWITNNYIKGKNYVDGTGNTTNTFEGNKYE